MNGEITISDGTGTPLTLTLTLDEGNFSVSGMGAKLRGLGIYQSRGVTKGVQYTERTYPSGSFSSFIAEWSDTTTGTLWDMILGTAGTPFAARESTLGASHPVVALDIKLKWLDHEGSGRQIDLHDCVINGSLSEGDPNTLSFDFQVLGEIGGDLTIDG